MHSFVSEWVFFFLDHGSLLWLVCWAARMWEWRKKQKISLTNKVKGGKKKKKTGTAQPSRSVSECDPWTSNPCHIGNCNRGNKENRGCVGRRGRGSQITRLCLSILSRLSPAQPGSIDFVWGLERPTASDYLGEWAVLCKQTLWPGLF